MLTTLGPMLLMFTIFCDMGTMVSMAFFVVSMVLGGFLRR